MTYFLDFTGRRYNTGVEKMGKLILKADAITSFEGHHDDESRTIIIASGIMYEVDMPVDDIADVICPGSDVSGMN